ncbi:hypothetical protein KCU71_g16173, partial [Aureobasidium melanogenum]
MDSDQFLRIVQGANAIDPAATLATCMAVIAYSGSTAPASKAPADVDNKGASSNPTHLNLLVKYGQGK